MYRKKQEKDSVFYAVLSWTCNLRELEETLWKKNNSVVKIVLCTAFVMSVLRLGAL